MDSKNISQNKKESNVGFKNIKSDYILKKIFNFISKLKSLETIKYNKRLQNRLNINIDDYKNYSEKLPIEIEIIPIKNGIGKFINKSGEYYHIYFNENKNEIKKNYLSEEDKVSKIKIIIDYQIK